MEMIQDTTRSVKVFLVWLTWVLTSTEPRPLSDCLLWWHMVIEIYQPESVIRKWELTPSRKDFSITLVVWSVCKWGCMNTKQINSFRQGWFFVLIAGLLKKKNSIEAFFSLCWQLISQFFRHCVYLIINKSLRVSSRPPGHGNGQGLYQLHGAGTLFWYGEGEFNTQTW